MENDVEVDVHAPEIMDVPEPENDDDDSTSMQSVVIVTLTTRKAIRKYLRDGDFHMVKLYLYVRTCLLSLLSRDGVDGSRSGILAR